MAINLRTRSRAATFLSVPTSLFLSGCTQQQSNKPVQQQGFRCGAYETQIEAQKRWKNAGRPSWADRDHDGLVCERMNTAGRRRHFSSSHVNGGQAKTAGCRRQKQPVSVAIDPRKYPYTARHIEEAQRAGEAIILHIDRSSANAHRDRSLMGIPTKKGFDRDEYPPAMSREGGAGADVKYVPSDDNRGSGRTMGMRLGKYCDGQAFRLLTF